MLPKKLKFCPKIKILPKKLKFWSKPRFHRKLVDFSFENLPRFLESLDVVASYDFENDEWGEEGSLGLARGSSDAAVVRLPKSYWTNRLF